ncbi:MAG: hypothetical protein ACFE96_07160 [Candidatus Hermodarchaeota archaeon]
MSLEGLTQIDILTGIFSSIFAIVCIIMGVIIISKYFKLKNKELFTFGLTWIFLGSSWWGTSLSFFNYLFFDVAYDITMLLFIGEVFFPLTVIFWMYSFSVLLYPNTKKKITIIFTLIVAIYEIFLIYFIFNAPTIIAIEFGMFDTQYNLFGLAYQGFAYIVSIVTGLLFSVQSIKSENPVVKWKGRFILLAIVTFSIAAVFQTLLPTNTIAIILVYILLIISVFEFYLGFLLPERLKNWLIKYPEN